MKQDEDTLYKIDIHRTESKISDKGSLSYCNFDGILRS